MASVTIFSGSGSRQQALAHASRLEGVLALSAETLPAIPWKLPRLLLPELRRRLGDEAVEAAIAPHRVLLSLVLRGLSEQLSPEETRERQACSPYTHRRLPALAPDVHPLRTAWAEVLATLLRARPTILLIPEIGSLDPASLGLIRPVLGRVADPEILRVVLGARLPAAGGSYTEDLRRAALRSELVRLKALPQTRVIEGEDSEPVRPSAGDGRQVDLDPLDPGLDLRAWLAVAGRQGPVASRTYRSILRGIEAAFDGFGFGLVHSLAAQLATRDLGPSEAVDVHELAGISLHNLLSAGCRHPAAAERLEEHLRPVLDQESTPADRSFLFYILSIRASRQNADYDRALEAGERSIEAAREVRESEGLSRYLEAWAHFARAYALVELARSEEAYDSCRRAEELLRSVRPSASIPNRQLTISRVLVLDNLARVAEASGRRNRALRAQRSKMELLQHRPPEQRPMTTWLMPDPQVQDLRGESAIIAHELELARLDLDLEREAFCAESLAGMQFRLGVPVKAHALYSRVLEIWGDNHASREEQVQLRLNRAMTAFWADLPERSEEDFQVVLKELVDPASPQAGELQAFLALAAARAGRGEAAAVRVDRALAAVAAHGTADEQLRAHRWVAEAHLLLGRVEEAEKSLEAAVRLLGADSPPEDVFGLLGVRLACGPVDDRTVRSSVALAKEALVDPNAWWDLQRIVPAVWMMVNRMDPLEPVFDEETREDFRCLIVAAAHREDCAKWAWHLASQLGVGDWIPASCRPETPSPSPREQRLENAGPWIHAPA